MSRTLWSQVQLSLTPEPGSIIISTGSEEENRCLVHWYLAGVVKTLRFDFRFIPFVPCHSEILNRRNIPDITNESVCLILIHLPVRGVVQVEGDAVWNCWRQNKRDCLMIVTEYQSFIL